MHIFKRSYTKFILLLLLSIFPKTILFAQENSLKTKYFTVYYAQDCSLVQLADRLHAASFLHIDIFPQQNNIQDIQAIVSDLFDSLYLEVSDVIDIHMYSFEGTVRIMPGREELREILGAYFKKAPNVASFYSHANNTIYLSWPDLTLGVLVHEMAHAIISHYFVVPPSTKVQEILAGYVEYSIRKKAGLQVVK